MMDLIKKIKVYFNSFTKNNSSYNKEGIKPAHDWGVIMACGLVAFCFIVVASAYIYIQTSRGTLFSVSTEDYSVDEEKINHKLLDDIVNKSEIKRASYEEMRENKTFMTDPSL